jgi:hypothetical protein
MTTTVALDDVTVPAPPAGPADWNDDGVVILPAFIPDAAIDAYCDEWLAQHGPTPNGGWPDCTPYMRHPALRRIVCDRHLARVLEVLLGEPAAVHLNLTGWVTTERDWHQDSYLNPPHVGDHYAAVWIALDDIHPDSGPFQYVPGSHRWPQVTRDLIGQHVDLGDPRWPKHSETILSPLFEAEIARRHPDIVTYLPKRGDVLVWHGRLLHRGTKANVPGMERRALIAHYSGIHSREDMPRAIEDAAGGWLFPIGSSGPVA